MTELPDPVPMTTRSWWRNSMPAQRNFAPPAAARSGASAERAWHASPVRTERGFDRLVNFSDATVAIAMTLLVLPLVDLGGASGQHNTLWELLSANAYEIFGFVLSFLVIWSLWVNHHRVMEYFAHYDSTVMGLHLVWLLTMVTIPFTTQLLTNTDLLPARVRPRSTSPSCWCRRSPFTCSAFTADGTRSCFSDRPEVTEWLAGPYTWTAVIVLTRDPRRRRSLPGARRVAAAAALRGRDRREPVRPAPEGRQPLSDHAERIAASSRYPLRCACCSGVTPSLSAIDRFAPAASRIRTTS